MNKASTDRKARAATYTELAQEGEAVEAASNVESVFNHENGVDAFFTCNLVLHKMGKKERGKYCDIFVEDHEELWRDHCYCMSRRVLSLCFMAAMVEAGDA